MAWLRGLKRLVREYVLGKGRKADICEVTHSGDATRALLDSDASGNQLLQQHLEHDILQFKSYNKEWIPPNEFLIDLEVILISNERIP